MFEEKFWILRTWNAPEWRILAILWEYFHHGWRKLWILMIWNAPEWRNELRIVLRETCVIKWGWRLVYCDVLIDEMDVIGWEIIWTMMVLFYSFFKSIFLVKAWNLCCTRGCGRQGCAGTRLCQRFFARDFWIVRGCARQFFPVRGSSSAILPSSPEWEDIIP